MTPAEAFHVGRYVHDELAARSWSLEYFAEQSRVPIDSLRAIVAEQEVPDELNLLRISQAFGTSVRLWSGLNDAWIRYTQAGGKS